MKLNLEQLDVTSFASSDTQTAPLALVNAGQEGSSYPHICPTPTTTTGVI